MALETTIRWRDAGKVAVPPEYYSDELDVLLDGERLYIATFDMGGWKTIEDGAQVVGVTHFALDSDITTTEGKVE